jgi:hypothetical protein
MTAAPEPMPPDLAELREEHPGWRFGTVWTTAGSGPDRRRVWAVKEGIMLSAWTAAELADGIRREEAGR